MDIVLIAWAVIASILFVMEMNAHSETRDEFMRFRAEVAVGRVIDEHIVQNLKPAKEIEHNRNGK